MLKIQKQFLDYLNKLLDTTSGLAIDKFKFENLAKQIEKTELIVPIVGGFSAGKSTLINHFLEDNILSTALTPETALATELRYSDDEYIEAIKKDDSIDKYDIGQIDDLKQKAIEYKYIKLYLNNFHLKTIEPLVLVDMPGFDAPIEHHNQAILNYLDKGIYFIILTSVEDGNLTKSTLREISNIIEIGKEFSFCLSKTNLKPKTEVEEIKNKIEEQLEDYFDYDKEVILTKNNGEELGKILSSINSEKLFESIFKEELIYKYIEIESSINTIISTLKISKEEAEDIIRELEDKIKIIWQKKDSLIEKTEEKYTNTNIDGIINKVGNDLLLQKENLISCALLNQNGFSQEINSIIKNTIISENKIRFSNISNDIVDNFTIELKGLNIDNFNLGDEWVNKIESSTKNLLKNAQSGINTYVDTRKKSINSSGLYKSVTTVLGITTSIVNPAVEVLIIFLPEILDFFKDKIQRQKIEKRLVSEIIPSIKSKLRIELPNLFNTYLKNTIELISQKYEEELTQKKEEIIVTQEEKQEEQKDIEERINSLELIKKDIQTLTTNYLYKEL